jgi:hypothetical protein
MAVLDVMVNGIVRVAYMKSRHRCVPLEDTFVRPFLSEFVVLTYIYCKYRDMPSLLYVLSVLCSSLGAGFSSLNLRQSRTWKSKVIMMVPFRKIYRPLHHKGVVKGKVVHALK